MPIKSKTNLISILLLITTMALFNEFNLLLLITCLIIIIKNFKKISKHVIINLNFIVLVFFILLYLLIYSLYREVNIVTILSFFLAIISYLTGQLLINNKNDSKILNHYIAIVAIGTAIHGTLNLFYNLSLYGIDFPSRVVPDYWTKKLLTATLHATLFCPLIGTSFYIIFICKFKENMFLKIFGITLLVSGLIFNLLLGNRTFFILFILCNSLGAYIFIKSNKNKAILTLKSLILILFMLIIGYIIYTNDVLYIRSFIESTTLQKRIVDEETSLLNDPRFFAISIGIKQLFLFPLGGFNMYKGELSFFHNTWLDTLNATGLIPFSLLLIYTFLCIKNCFILVKKKYVPISTKLIIICTYFVTFLNFMFEPIFEGAVWLFIIFCFINGLTDKYIMLQKKF